jgi:hypothetical protein
MYGGRYLAQVWFAASNFGEPWLMPTVAGSGMRPSRPGSGKFGTPWARTQRANSRAVAVTCNCSASLGARPPFGSKRRQELCAAWYCELLTPSCCRLFFGGIPLLSGSGNLGTPFERMQLEKASHPFPCVACVAGEPPHAAAARAKDAAVIAAAMLRVLVARPNGLTLSMVAGSGNRPTSGR